VDYSFKEQKWNTLDKEVIAMVAHEKEYPRKNPQLTGDADQKRIQWSMVAHTIYNRLIRVKDGIVSRLLAWRGVVVILELLLLMGVGIYFYSRVHNYNVSLLLSSESFQLPILDFILGEGFVPTAVEVVFWTSIGVIIKHLSTIKMETQRNDFDLLVYFGEVIAEWISMPIAAAVLVFFLRMVQFNLGKGIELSLSNADIGVVIGMSLLLGFFSEDIMPLLRELRVRLTFGKSKPDV
jgi:hypothetical protein